MAVRPPNAAEVANAGIYLGSSLAWQSVASASRAYHTQTSGECDDEGKGVDGLRECVQRESDEPGRCFQK